MMYPFPGSYNPFGPHAPQQAAPVADVPLARIEAAERAGARWLGADGLRAYCERYGATFEAEWDGARFGSWFPCAELPAGAVVIP